MAALGSCRRCRGWNQVDGHQGNKVRGGFRPCVTVRNDSMNGNSTAPNKNASTLKSRMRSMPRLLLMSVPFGRSVGEMGQR